MALQKTSSGITLARCFKLAAASSSMSQWMEACNPGNEAIARCLAHSKLRARLGATALKQSQSALLWEEE
jgi:hypothetical protein